MSTPTTDEAAFLRAIAAQPGEDTPRLAYSDWLDDHCDCLGEGRRTDGRNDRAWYIREAINRRSHELSDGYSRTPKDREPELLKQHEPEWRKVGACPECGGTGTQGRRNGHDGLACKHCWGSGDVGGLVLLPSINPLTRDRVLRVDWQRGFPHRVYCQLSDVCLRPMQSASSDRHVPTSWALAVVRHHPVTEFYVELPFTSSDVANAWFKSSLPPFLFDLIQNHDAGTPEAAHTAMARALGTWVRGFPPKEPL